MKISEIAELTGLDISTIRFYERKGLISPARAEGSTYRSYTEEDIRRLKQIVLYRKINLSIEGIGHLLERPTDLPETLKTQEAALLTERERLDNSLDLCRKMIANNASEGFDLNYYLHYVKTEEAQGRKYPEILETLDGIAERSGIERLIGFPLQSYLLRYKWLRRLTGAAIFLILVVFPACMVIEKMPEWRNGQIGSQSLIAWGFWILILLLFWGSFIKIVRGEK